MDSLQNLGNMKKLDFKSWKISFGTFLAIGLLINSFNYVDGVDGLLNGITIIAISYFNFLIGSTQVFQFYFYYLIYGLIINLFFNLLTTKSEFKCFMGDAGSLFLGFLTSFLYLFIHLYEYSSCIFNLGSLVPGV